MKKGRKRGRGRERERDHPPLVQVLLQCDKDPPLILCAKFLAAYDKLKQAKLELFGGHSQFAIALKEGFARAFQCLDEVRMIRVSRNHEMSV